MANPFDAIKQQFRQQYPDISEHALIVKCKEAMKDSFVQAFAPTRDDASMTSVHSEDHNNFTCLAGESQDPNDDEVTVGDF